MSQVLPIDTIPALKTVNKTTLPDDTAVAFYQEKIEKLKKENKNLQAQIRHLDLSKQTAYETSEAEVTSQFSSSIFNSLKKLGISQMQTMNNNS